MTRPTLRFVALFTALCFLNLDYVVLMQGRAQVQTASAQGKARRVALFVFPKRDDVEGDAQVLQTLLRTEVDGLAGIRLVTGTPEPEASVENQVAPMIEDGIRALNSKDEDQAERYLSQAYERLIRNTGTLPRRAMARTLKGLGVARVMSGQLRAGQEMMRASLNLWPDQQPPEYGYTLDVLNAFKTVQQQHAEGATGSVAVITEPAGARISVDGDVKGYATLKVGDLPAGLHWVEGTLDGYVRAGAFVEIRGDAEVTHRFALQPRANSGAYEALMDEITRSIRRKSKMEAALPGLSALLGAEEVMVLSVDSRGSSYSFQGWHQSQAGLASIKQSIQRDAQFLASLHGLVSDTLRAQPAEDELDLPLDAPPQATSVGREGSAEAELVIDPNDAILKSSSASADEPLTSKWWFWTIIGSAVAGVAVGLGVALSGDETASGPVGDLTINLNDF